MPPKQDVHFDERTVATAAAAGGCTKMATMERWDAMDLQVGSCDDSNNLHEGITLCLQMYESH
jgi:hypothetical protein